MIAPKRLITNRRVDIMLEDSRKFDCFCEFEVFSGPDGHNVELADWEAFIHNEKYPVEDEPTLRAIGKELARWTNQHHDEIVELAS
jgi:hypothetical protein